MEERDIVKNLLWVDLEMTGLDVNKEVIIEVAAIVTDTNLTALETFHSVVKQPQSYLDNMDDWNQKHHQASGLLEKIPHGKNQKTVEDDLLSLIEQHFPKEMVVLAGNTIGQDRIFINKYMPRVAEKLHYRMLDVTAWKIVLNNFYKIVYEKGVSSHRALDDIQESIKEFKYYLQFIKPDLEK